jgi:transcriptional regulator with XRE-family HTH domain
MDNLKNKLCAVIGDVVKRNRKKSITKSADEIGMWKSLWADLEHGIKDPQFSTLWRVAEGLDLKPHELVKMIEDEIGNNFSFIENTL